MKCNIKEDGRKYIEFEFDGSCRKAYLVRREDKLPIKEAVYILMDMRKHCFYIGQTGDGDCAGFVNRSVTHKWEKKWWEEALVFTDEHGAFQEKLRKWIEGRLNEIAKKANTSLVMSTGKKDPVETDVSWKGILDWILKVCRLCGLPWAYPVECSEMLVVEGEVCRESDCVDTNWGNPTQLAKAIIKKFAPSKTHGHVYQLLTRRSSCKSGEWRSRLESIGLSFDPNGYVKDWKKAKRRF